MEKLIIQNGGKYSAELTKLCTHLICEISLILQLIILKIYIYVLIDNYG